MVYCQYCGARNRDGDLRCYNCGKPLSLMPSEQSQKSGFSSNTNQNLRDSFRNNPKQEGSIKNRYIQREQAYQDNPNDPHNPNSHNYQNQQVYHDNQPNRHYQNHQSYQNQQNQQSYQDYQNQQNQQNHPRNQEYEYPDDFNRSELNRQYPPNDVYEPKKVSKTTIEWDVVIATALMVIILTAILQRVFPVFAIFISLFLGLAYILVATKSKPSLIKSIPLTFFVILAISAYFSL